jgi:hypothetical protein
MVFSQSRQVLNLPNIDNPSLQFGFLLGINQMDFSVKTYPGFQNKLYSGSKVPGELNIDTARVYSVEPIPVAGFVVGIISRKRISNYLDMWFTPSLAFGERDLNFTIQNVSGNAQEQLLTIRKNVQSSFVDLPLWFRFAGKRINNVRPYILGGAKYSIDLASNAKKKRNSNQSEIFLQKNNIHAELGAGFDFYFEWFKFGVEMRMSYGLFDILKRDNMLYTDPIQSLRSKIFQLTLTFM